MLVSKLSLNGVVGTFEILWVCYGDGNLTFESQTSIYTKCEHST